MGLKTPVLFLVFNRPDLTARVFDAIRKAAPLRLYVACDGPREGNASDLSQVAAVRGIVSCVDWPCRVETFFGTENAGCKRACSSAVSWFFENEEEGIVLEDDCLPDPSFFPFCEELLIRYRHDKHVAFISGNNFQRKQPSSEDSYYFSRYNHIWGWASWRRAWKYYDVKMSAWPQVKREKSLRKEFGRAEYAFWEKKFDAAFYGRIDSWAYPLTFAFWAQGGLSILPHLNLVSNIGFGDDATHTKIVNERVVLPAQSMRFPIRHPECLSRNRRADHETFTICFRLSLFRSLLNRWRHLVRESL